jgi:DNA-binding transcriptional LysR family regulator
MDRLEAMTYLVAAVEAGSFAAAGRKLGVPLPTLSRKVGDLEAHLKVRLLVRGTRKLTLTDAGVAYLAASRRILDEVSEAERAATGEYEAARGELVVTAPVVFGRLHVLPVVYRFLAAHPEIAVRLTLADHNLHLLDEQIDVALRIGRLPDSSLVATPIGEVRRIVCASPAYLVAHGTPKRPQDLAGHACVTHEFPGAGAWMFRTSDGHGYETAPVRPRLRVNSAEAAIDAAVLGGGLTQVLSYQVAARVAARQLKLVLRDYDSPPIPVHLVQTGQKPLPLKVRRFLDFATPLLRTALAKA